MLLRFFIFSFLISCTQDANTCRCNILEINDIRKGLEKNEKVVAEELGFDTDTELILKKNITQKLGLKGDYSNAASSIREVYNETLSSNPHITQKANLYRLIAMASCDQICNDVMLNDSIRFLRQREVIQIFNTDIRKIIESGDFSDSLPANLIPSILNGNKPTPETIDSPIKVIDRQ